MTEPFFSLLLHLEEGAEASLATLRSVAEHTPPEIEYDTLILDDATSDATAQLLGQLAGSVQVLRSDERIGRAAALARLAQASRAPVVVILSQGAVLAEDWAAPLLAALRDPGVVAVQSLVLDGAGAVVSAGIDLADDLRPIPRWHGHAYADELPPSETVDALDGVCAAIRTAAFAASGLDPAYPPGPVGFAEFSRRCAAGGARLLVATASRVTFGRPLDLRSGMARFRRLAARPNRRGSRTRTVALYLPAFHRVAENDRWWGDGFTEWTNVIRAQPLFDGHEQPHLPADLGLYDLRLPEARAAQAELAERFGISAFCYYHYWFHGRRLLERPFAAVLESGEPGLPFCLCWANEDWRANWDGSSGELLMAQEYSAEDDLEHIRWLCGAFRDPRYLRVDGAPLFLLYRANRLPDVAATLELWREEARREGVGELFLCRVESFDDERDDPRPLGFDASVEFQPDWLQLGRMSGATGPARAIYDYHAFTRHMQAKPAPEWRRIPCVTPSWDNTARRRHDATILANSHPVHYRSWVETVARREERDHPDSPLVFVNAWNEWGEGAHLEPDERWGTAFLEAHRDATRAAGRTVARDRVLCVAGVHPVAVSQAAAWLGGCGLAIDPAAADPAAGPTDFAQVNDAAIRRQWPDSRGPWVLDERPGWFSSEESAQACAAIARRRRARPCWGWADPGSVVLLDAWTDLVPELRTLLLWSRAEGAVGSILSAAAAGGSSLDEPGATALWLAFARRVVAYRETYPEHCVLVEADTLSERPLDVVARLNEQLDGGLQYRPPGPSLGSARPAAPPVAVIDPEVARLEDELARLSALAPPPTPEASG